jgi:hypothetical protein
MNQAGRKRTRKSQVHWSLVGWPAVIHPFQQRLNQLFASFSLEGIIENPVLRHCHTKHLSGFR